MLTTLISLLLIPLLNAHSKSCGFDHNKSIPKYRLDGPNDNLRFLESKEFTPLRIYIDYTTMDNQTNIPVQLRNNIKTIMQNTKYLYENLIKVQRLGFPVKVKECDPRVTISSSISNNGAEADLVIFPFIDDSNDNDENTEAYASSCVLATKNNRPVAGIIAFTQAMAKYRENWIQFYTNLAFHEIGHILLFNPFLYDMFIDEQGDPIPSSQVYKSMEVNGLTRNMIITPKVVEAAKKHFNCDDVQGVELENQGGQGTENSHWEARVMLSDLMIGFTYDEAVLSEITLAFYEDSGWYKANYYTGGLFRFGKNEGCGFLTEKCIGGSHSYSNEFCNSQPYTPTCTAGHLSRAVCYYTNTYSNIDTNYRYFGSANTGGLILPDYCPVAAVPTNTTNYMPYNCVTGLQGSPAEFDEKIGDGSLCFMSNLVKKNIFGYKNKNAVCYQHECDLSNRKLFVTVGDLKLQCPYEGGDVTSPGYVGSLKCPAFENICTGSDLCNNLIDCVVKKVVPFGMSQYANYTMPKSDPNLTPNITATSNPDTNPNTNNPNTNPNPNNPNTNPNGNAIPNPTGPTVSNRRPVPTYTDPRFPNITIDFSSSYLFNVNMYMLFILIILFWN
jgi:hypothetical protein